MPPTVSISHFEHAALFFPGLYLTIPPGFSRGLDFQDAGSDSDAVLSGIPDATKQLRRGDQVRISTGFLPDGYL
jgi:hypothetical protein